VRKKNWEINFEYKGFFGKSFFGKFAGRKIFSLENSTKKLLKKKYREKMSKKPFWET
jgi:hypothetical protein